MSENVSPHGRNSANAEGSFSNSGFPCEVDLLDFSFVQAELDDTQTTAFREPLPFLDEVGGAIANDSDFHDPFASDQPSSMAIEYPMSVRPSIDFGNSQTVNPESLALRQDNHVTTEFEYLDHISFSSNSSTQTSQSGETAAHVPSFGTLEIPG